MHVSGSGRGLGRCPISLHLARAVHAFIRMSTSRFSGGLLSTVPILGAKTEPRDGLTRHVIGNGTRALVAC